MKTTVSTPAPDQGANNPRGGLSSVSQPSANRGAAANTPASDPANSPAYDPTNPTTVPTSMRTGHYDRGHPYGTIRYGLDDPLPPVNEGAKVKMGLSGKTTNQLIPYIQNHIEMMTGNANFVTPQPPAVDFLAQFNAYQDAAMAAINAEAAWKDAVALRDQRRTEMTATMNVRGAYVQETSNGNRQVILSSGLGVKNPPTPVTSLSAPTNLRVDLNGEAGMMKIRWDTVTAARTYVVQCSLDVMPRVWEQLESTTKTMVTKTMEVGQTYVFRVAANGTPGQSNWSPEVIRGAA